MLRLNIDKLIGTIRRPTSQSNSSSHSELLIVRVDFVLKAHRDFLVVFLAPLLPRLPVLHDLAHVIRCVWHLTILKWHLV